MERRSGDKYIFLLGGDPSQKAAAQAFVDRAGGKTAILLLMLMNKQGWQNYLPYYIDNWLESGISEYNVIMPDENGSLDYELVAAQLKKATGVFIGGGDTLKYHSYFASEPIRSELVRCYENGTVLAGCSAGALIMPEIMLASTKDTGDDQIFIGEGMGMVRNQVIGVHFSEWNDINNLVDGMIKTKTGTGWGIDEKACAVFKNGMFESAFGNAVHKIEIEDFESRKYRITTVASLK